MLRLHTCEAVSLVERVRAIPRNVRSHAETVTSNSLCPRLTSSNQRRADSTATLAVRNDETENLCWFVVFKRGLDCDVHPSDDNLSIVGDKNGVIMSSGDPREASRDLVRTRGISELCDEFGDAIRVACSHCANVHAYPPALSPEP